MIFQSILGFVVFVGIAWLVSENRRKIVLRTVIIGLVLQLVLGVVLLKLPAFQDAFLSLNKVILALEESTAAGTEIVFGYLGGDTPPYDEITPGRSYIFAFRGLPLILIMSALSSLLFFWKILPVVVRGFSWVLQRTMRIGGAEGVGVAANIFVGMVEAPLLVRPYLKNMTRSEIFSLMTCGMATVAGTVMIRYASFLQGVIDNALGHILTASIISAPAAITIAKIMVPETESVTTGKLVPPVEAKSSMDAITKGTVQGVHLLVSVAAMIIVLVALVHLVNVMLGIIPDAGGGPITLQRMLGWIMAPVVWLMGIQWRDSAAAGSLMGTKTVLNELIAYLDMARMGGEILEPRSRTMLMYAMCGFANPGSLGIMIGGLGAMAPERRDEIVSLVFRSILAGTLATCMTGAVAGMLL